MIIIYSLFGYTDWGEGRSEEKDGRQGKDRAESEAISRLIWHSKQWQQAWDNVSKLFFPHSHAPVSQLSVHGGGCAPVIRSRPIARTQTLTQNVTPETKCHPSYSDTHKQTEIQVLIGQGSWMHNSCVNALLSPEHRVGEVSIFQYESSFFCDKWTPDSKEVLLMVRGNKKSKEADILKKGISICYIFLCLFYVAYVLMSHWLFSTLMNN